MGTDDEVNVDGPQLTEPRVEYGVLIDRARLHVELERWIDKLIGIQPLLEEGHEHVIVFSGGCLDANDDGARLTDITITTTETRHL